MEPNDFKFHLIMTSKSVNILINLVRMVGLFSWNASRKLLCHLGMKILTGGQLSGYI